MAPKTWIMFGICFWIYCEMWLETLTIFWLVLDVAFTGLVWTFRLPRFYRKTHKEKRKWDFCFMTTVKSCTCQPLENCFCSLKSQDTKHLVQSTKESPCWPCSLAANRTLATQVKPYADVCTQEATVLPVQSSCLLPQYRLTDNCMRLKNTPSF